MDKVYRDVRLHYGGVFHENSLIEGIDLYQWIGGAFVDVKKVCLEPETLEGVTRLFTKHCPLNQNMNLRFYYTVGGSKFELDKDMEVQFAWSICSKTSQDVMRNIYCVSDLVIPSPSISLTNSKTNSHSHTVSHSVSLIEEQICMVEAPPVDTTQDSIIPILVPRVQTILDGYISQEQNYLTQPSGNGSFCVRKFTGEHWTVNLYRQECSCGEWQVTGIPCVHGVHVIRNSRLNLAQYCNPLLTVKAYKMAYSENIEPIPQQSDWPGSDYVVMPPTITRSAGRPRKNRIKGHDERDIPDFDKKGIKRCGKCNAFGHNSRTCQGGPTKKQIIQAARVGRGARTSQVGGEAVGQVIGQAGGQVGRGRGGRGPRGGRSGALRGGRGGAGRGTRGAGRGPSGGRGEAGRGGAGSGATNAQTPMNAEAPRTSVKIPPPPPRKQADVATNSKKRKIFHPKTVPFLP